MLGLAHQRPLSKKAIHTRDPTPGFEDKLPRSEVTVGSEETIGSENAGCDEWRILKPRPAQLNYTRRFPQVATTIQFSVSHLTRILSHKGVPYSTDSHYTVIETMSTMVKIEIPDSCWLTEKEQEKYLHGDESELNRLPSYYHQHTSDRFNFFPSHTVRHPQDISPVVSYLPQNLNLLPHNFSTDLISVSLALHSSLGSKPTRLFR